MEEYTESLDQNKDNGISEAFKVLRSEFLAVASKSPYAEKFMCSEEGCYDLTIPAKSQKFGPLFISFDELITVFLGVPSHYHEHSGRDCSRSPRSTVSPRRLAQENTADKIERRGNENHMFDWGL